MRILEIGKRALEMEIIGLCPHCDSKFTFTLSDVIPSAAFTGYKANSGESYIRCPVCNKIIIVEKTDEDN